MNSHKKTAIIVGVLFLIVLVFNILGMAIYDPILYAPDFSPPFILNELTLSVWLIVKGFNPSVIASGSVK